MKLKAGALLYVIGLALVIGLLTGAMLIWVYGEGLSFKRLIGQDRLIRNAQSGLVLLLADMDSGNKQKEEIDLFGDQQDYVELTSIPWGMFQVARSVARSGHSTFTLCAITGVDYSDDLPALYLTDRGRPLSLAGKASIEGNIFASNAGLKRIYIDNRGSGGTNLLDGERFDSEKHLPDFREGIGQNNLVAVADSLLNIEYPLFADTVFGDIDKGLTTLVPSGPLEIGSAAFISGFIAINSNYNVTVQNGAKLDNILIKAPSVVFQSGFEGSVQVEATDSIVLEERVRLHYPSSLVISAEYSKGYIRLWSNSSVSGGVATLAGEGDSPQLYIHRNAVVSGLVYSRGKVTLLGQVVGSVFCEAFFLKTPSSVYENTVWDGQINVGDLDQHFVFPPVLHKTGKMKVVKWVH